MAQPQLSQEEVDALMAGSTAQDAAHGAAAPLETAAAPRAADAPDATDASGVRRYDLSSEERIVRGAMPALEIVNERFARNFRTGLFSFMRRNPEIATGAVKVQKFSTFMRGITAPSSINLMHVRPLRGTGLVICDPALVFSVIDSLFGGNGKQASALQDAPAREFSATEQRIVMRLVETIATEYAKSWAPTYPLTLEYARTETHPQFANIATPSELVVTTSFHIGLGGSGDEGTGGGELHICIPYSSLEPIRETLYSPQGEQDGAAGRWVTLLTQQIKAATVELAAELAHSQATVGELMALKAGDFIELDRLPTLVTKVDGVPVFECDYGTLGSRYGVRIREFLTRNGEPASSSLPAAN